LRELWSIFSGSFHRAAKRNCEHAIRWNIVSVTGGYHLALTNNYSILSGVETRAATTTSHKRPGLPYRYQILRCRNRYLRIRSNISANAGSRRLPKTIWAILKMLRDLGTLVGYRYRNEGAPRSARVHSIASTSLELFRQKSIDHILSSHVYS
jgi:hypothetical protein